MAPEGTRENEEGRGGDERYLRYWTVPWGLDAARERERERGRERCREIEREREGWSERFGQGNVRVL